MSPYLDAGFLLTLLVPTHGSALANQLLRHSDAPFELNFLHQLQAENLLRRMELSSDPARQIAGRKGRALWRHYLDEGVFLLDLTDWNSALEVAIAWNEHHSSPPPPPLLLLHPALAAISACTAFLSFDPRSRSVAQAVGLRVLPDRL